ncbi:hypothetical protein D3C86_2181140 [compost metagenome]
MQSHRAFVFVSGSVCGHPARLERLVAQEAFFGVFRDRIAQGILEHVVAVLPECITLPIERDLIPRSQAFI